jgi:hypothetical protein
MNAGHGFFGSRPARTLLGVLAALLLLPACAPGPQSNEDLRKEIQGLKSEVTALKEKINQLQTSQAAILDLLKKWGAPPPETAFIPPPPPQPQPQFQAPEAPQPPGGPQPLTVSQLIAGKDRFLGARVTVKGPVGPVLVHHKSLLLKSPEGLVEVFFGKLPDEKQIQRLTSFTLDQPITVTGVVSGSPKGGAKLEIQAEAIEF